MIIKTITCHDVYNTGSSLQAYALQTYLEAEGHDVSIIDYKPDYLSNHYKYCFIPNSKFQKPVLKQLYILMKFPERFLTKHQKRKKNFDNFRNDYLHLTERYCTFDELKKTPPVADVVIAGSDQIWNPIFQNGKDPAFYLQFVPEGTKRISYAASFSVDAFPEELSVQVASWLSELHAVSVREASGLDILSQMNIQYGVQVLDPVFLLDKEQWQIMATQKSDERYVFVYDFDNNLEIRKAAERIATRKKCEIITLQSLNYGEKTCSQAGPKEFVQLIAGAECVISNSFHATAFSLIFEKEFWVFNRNESINTRMRDLTLSMGIPERFVTCADEIDINSVIDYFSVRKKSKLLIEKSKTFLKNALVDGE